MKIWHQSSVDLDNYPVYRESLARHYARIANPGTEIILHGVPESMWHGKSPSEVMKVPYAYHKAMSRQLLHNVHRAEQEGYDAFVIGTYTEPLLRECRSLVDIPVISMPESTVLISCSMAQQIGLVTLNEENQWFLKNAMQRHRLEARISGIYVIEPQLPERAIEQMFLEPGDYIAAFTATARRAIAAGADLIVPAEGLVAEVLVANDIYEIDGVSVLDGVGAPLSYAEMLAKLHRLTGLHAGRRWHYIKPSAELLALYPPD
ncbi:aspartate/glutamate racemase family protein [Pseudomonas sp. S 311-6]|uniref:aspartate/glutamate racemase family protein n=1 Tax=Kerstersia gyiorum TaxID=206506 RepID=UPI002097970D|nr:aspartate/glutamate racemase family protein [Pseudomonas sp. S 311-6]